MKTEQRMCTLETVLKRVFFRVFLETLLKNQLDLPDDTELRIKQAHRALAPKPTNGEMLPNFLSYQMKEDVL